jgi:predicted AlkP superfamily phosphohydrolase/phosphomutase
MRFPGFVAPLAVAATVVLAGIALSDTPTPAQPARQRVWILGFDGMDPNVVDRLIAQGKLPNLAWMKQHGAMRRLETTNPAQSPVAWSSFSTGMNPGKTRIYDFLRRNPATYYPDFSTVTLQRGKFAMGFLPTQAPRIINNRKGTTFWQIASRHGVKTVVLEAPIDFPPEELQNGVLLSGLGVPDIRGTMGTFSYYATDAVNVGDTEMGGKVARLKVDRTGRTRSVVHGPRNPFASRDSEGRIPDLTIPIEFQRVPGTNAVRISLQGQVRTVRQGDWSDWYKIRFTIAPLVAVNGIGRFHVMEASPELRVYLSPINFDPRHPPVPISKPNSYSADAARRLGLYKTLGWPEDTWALNEEKIDEKVFMEDVNYSFSRQRALVLDAIDRLNPDLFVTVFQATDKVQHMMWRLIDPKHPMYNRRLAEQYGGSIDRTYMRCDSLVGLFLRRAARDPRITLLIVSDHGFSSFRKAVNINTWLVRNGYMTLARQDPVRDRNLEDLFGRGTFWPNVDWSKTRAYALALGQIYVNLKGRESHGTVSPGPEYDALKRELVEKFGALRDPDTGERVVRKVYTREELYHGAYFGEAPDMVVGFEEGYRVSWQTSLGGIPPEVIEPNERRWSADHCSVDPETVKGVFLSNRPIDSAAPRIDDVAPSVLARLGIAAPPDMDGRQLGLH